MYMGDSEKIEQSLHSMLYVLDKVSGFVDFHKLFKILYFADQKHLVRYGNPISEDYYIAMNNGPVPSISYDILKAVRGDALLKNYQDFFANYFEIKDKYLVKAKIKPDLDYFSKSEMDCINESIKENKDLSFAELTQKSHDIAWNSAIEDYLTDTIDTLKIAEAGGADSKMIKYIETHLENQFATFE